MAPARAGSGGAAAAGGGTVKKRAAVIGAAPKLNSDGLLAAAQASQV